jgi:hypothetical protein
MEADYIIKTRIESILPILDERQRRIYLSAEAKSIGWGGKSKISELSSVTRRTIAKGEVESSLENRIRKEGGGRKKSVEQQPEILQIIEDLVSPYTLGDPMNPLIWTSKSLTQLEN